MLARHSHTGVDSAFPLPISRHDGLSGRSKRRSSTDWSDTTAPRAKPNDLSVRQPHVVDTRIVVDQPSLNDQGVLGEFGLNLSFTDPTEPDLALRFARWGPPDDLQSVTPIAPTVAPCATAPTTEPDIEQGQLDTCLHDVHYPYNGITEWWRNGPDDLQQGWTIDRYPTPQPSCWSWLSRES
jgi:hypothetical protein